MQGSDNGQDVRSADVAPDVMRRPRQRGSAMPSAGANAQRHKEGGNELRPGAHSG